MNIYYQQQLWKRWLALVALLIVGGSLWYTDILVKGIAKDERNNVKLWAEAVRKKANLVSYTNELFSKLAVQERNKVELWASANRELSKDLDDYSFVLQVISDNTTVPVILTDEFYKPLDSRNLAPELMSDSLYLNAQIKEMRALHEPIEVVAYGQTNYLFYKDSKLFEELQSVLDDLIQSFILDVVVNAASVPVIYTDSTKQNVLAVGNIDSTVLKDPNCLQERLKEMGLEREPIEVMFGDQASQFVFYQESTLQTRLRYYPYLMLGVISLFLLVGYFLFSTARRIEQNQVWVGMSKETAHQLGTPLSSLLAWVEYLKMKDLDPVVIADMEKDVKRLEVITERFSKIGSLPILEQVNLNDVVTESLDYMESRVSKSVKFKIDTSSDFIEAHLNIPLFEWVIENLCRNAVDAMEGSGRIHVKIMQEEKGSTIEITDTGKGIEKANFERIFEPGFTSKERGWGLGLSLVKRIVESYHAGKIYVLNSEIGRGTTFRIELKTKQN